MSEDVFKSAYKALNNAQRRAVDTIEGPVLVIAGPGTGKTQLLSTRAAKIVSKGAVNANNILCLTFTETGASEMRQRLNRIMGPAGGDVAVHTFHSFGSWIINQYPEQFSSERSLKPLDDLGRYTIIADILQQLPFRHQLAIRDEHERFIRQHSVQEAIRAFKEAGMTPEMVRSQLQANEAEYKILQALLDELFTSNFSVKRLDEIESLTRKFQAKAAEHSFSSIVLQNLQAAVETSRAAGKTAALGKWRTSHTTVKDKQRVLKSAANSKLLHDVVDIYERYQHQLLQTGRFDYTDMILWATEALVSHDDMRLDIAERFQYIMVDEYQDTNGAQNHLLDSLLKANPLDSPNVLVVGDDDQAIMRFQGAEASGMLQFVSVYRPEIIVLQDNYRSTQAILDASRQIMTQTDERLEVSLPDMNLSKSLSAHHTATKVSIEHNQYESPSAEYEGIALMVSDLLKKGVTPSAIGIIGRKHAELAAFVPYLTAKGITINYDRRENILEHSAITQLLELARCVSILSKNPVRAETLLPSVLAANYWHLQPLDIYTLAARARTDKTTWLNTMLASEGKWHAIAEWLLAAAQASQTLNFTQTLDILLGREQLPDTRLKTSLFVHTYKDQPPEIYITILSHLLRLRSAVLENRPTAKSISDLIEVTDQYRQSDIRLLDDNPLLRGDAESVHIMSAHGAKGREFEHVIILSATDEVWGNRARGNNQRIFLPENLPLYQAGDTESDKLRLLFVAMTRAKSHLLLTSYAQSDAGKAMTPLSFLALGEEPTGWWQPVLHSLHVPEKQAALESAWKPLITTKKDLTQVLQPLLKNYRLSASALRDFLDLRYAGPQTVIEKHIVRFPASYNASSALGTAAHRTIQLAHAAWATGVPLSVELLLKQFDDALNASGLTEIELEGARAHGHQFLPAFLEKFGQTDFDKIVTTEQFLKADSPIHQIPLSGAIDALATQTEQSLRVIDYKTGSPPLPDWQITGLTDSKKTSLRFYKQQLLFYKLLVENSPLYKGKMLVDCTELVFVEQNDTGEIIRLDLTDFTNAELEKTEQLMKIVYDKILAVDLPDTSSYSKDLKGVQAFEQDLLDGTI